MRYSDLLSIYKEKLAVACDKAEISIFDESMQILEASLELASRGEFKLSSHQRNTASTATAALMTQSNKVFTGSNTNLKCANGICAEHSAIMDMLKHRETSINIIVATSDDGLVLPPCGNCREIMTQTDIWNYDNTNVIVPAMHQKTKSFLPDLKIVKLSELLPYHWIGYLKERRTIAIEVQ